jgi:hypothetical protein
LRAKRKIRTKTNQFHRQIEKEEKKAEKGLFCLPYSLPVVLVVFIYVVVVVFFFFYYYYYYYYYYSPPSSLSSSVLCLLLPPPPPREEARGIFRKEATSS